MDHQFSDLLQHPYDVGKWESLVEKAQANDGKGVTKSTDANKLQSVRDIFFKMLESFPLLVNYWIKLANMEYELGNFAQCDVVYEKAFQDLGSSLELWISYLKFKVSTTLITKQSVGQLLELFEKARSKIGLHYHASDFYKLYLNFLQSYTGIQPTFHRKYEVLLRYVVELPLYNYHYFFQLLINLNNSSKLQYITNGQNINSFKKTVIDIYITTQYKCYKLYQFEKSIRPYYDYKYLSQNSLDVLDRYLDYVELHYPIEFTVQAYERVVIITAAYSDIWNKYVEFLLQKRRYLQAELVLKKCIKLKRFNVEGFLVKLANIYLHMGKFLSARALLLNCNSVMAIEKLLSIEWLFKYGKEDHLMELFETLISHNEYFFTVLLFYNIDNQLKFKFFKRNYENNRASPSYQLALNIWLGFNSRYRTEFSEKAPETFDDIMTSYR